jgi:hypothetical protein
VTLEIERASSKERQLRSEGQGRSASRADTRPGRIWRRDRHLAAYSTLARMGSRSRSVNWAESNEPCSSSLGCEVSNSGGAFTPASTKAKLATLTE